MSFSCSGTGDSRTTRRIFVPISIDWIPRRTAVPGRFFIFLAALFIVPFTIAELVLPLRTRDCRSKFARKPRHMARGEEKPAMNLFRLLGLGFGLIAATANARAETIAVSATKSLASAAIFVADDRGFFRDEGITLDFKYFNAAQPVAVAVASGDAQFGITGLSAGFYNMAGKQSLKIVAAGAREEPGHSTGAYVVSEQAYEKGIKSVKDLKGARFGLTTVGSPYHY